jgi:hypothetical protein
MHRTQTPWWLNRAANFTYSGSRIADDAQPTMSAYATTRQSAGSTAFKAMQQVMRRQATDSTTQVVNKGSKCVVTTA